MDVVLLYFSSISINSSPSSKRTYLFPVFSEVIRVGLSFNFSQIKFDRELIKIVYKRFTTNKHQIQFPNLKNMSIIFVENYLICNIFEDILNISSQSAHLLVSLENFQRLIFISFMLKKLSFWFQRLCFCVFLFDFHISHKLNKFFSMFIIHDRFLCLLSTY